MAPGIGFELVRRTVPLSPIAVLGRGSVARSLAQALSARAAEELEVEIFAGDDWLLAIGQATLLPWVDGATWLGREAKLLLPTTLEPTVDAELLWRALRRRTGRASWTVLLPGQVLFGDRATGILDVARLRELAGGTVSP